MIPEITIERFEVFANGLDHPECLAFDRAGNLWAGGEAGQVYRISPGGIVTTIATLGGFNGGIAFNAADELIVCNPQHGLVYVKADGSHRVFATHAGNHKLICPNYPVFDAAGNLYVSDSGQWKKKNGNLLRFTPDGKGEIVGGPFGYANGLSLMENQKQLFMVESDTNSVYRFELGGSDISEGELYAQNVGRLPDGLALDALGNLYVSCYASDDVHRISPDGSKSLLAYDPFAILLSRPTNMAFGGPDFDEMYLANLGRTTITKVRIGVKGQRLANQRII